MLLYLVGSLARSASTCPLACRVVQRLPSTLRVLVRTQLPSTRMSPVAPLFRHAAWCRRGPSTNGRSSVVVDAVQLETGATCVRWFPPRTASGEGPLLRLQDSSDAAVFGG